MISSFRRVAITGASGYIAGRLIEEFEQNESIERIVATDVRRLKARHFKKVVFRKQDITSPLADLFSQNAVEAVIHLAYVLKPGHNKKKARRVNVSGTANVLEACAETGVKWMLYLSSTSVYGAHSENPPIFTEESPVRPIHGFQYSEDKVIAELLINDFVKRHPTLSATILRLCPVMGPNADNFISNAFSKPFLVGVKGYDPPRQFMHEADLIEIVMRCFNNQTTGTYNIAGEGSILWSEMVALFGRKLINIPAPLLYALTGLAWNLRLQNESPPQGINFIRYPLVVSIEKMKRELGFSPTYSSRQAWESFVNRPRSFMQRLRARVL